MRDRIKRTLALSLAILLFSAAIFNDGLTITLADEDTGTVVLRSRVLMVLP